MSVACRAILSNLFEEQCTKNHPQNIPGLCRSLFPATFLRIAVCKSALYTSTQTKLVNVEHKILWKSKCGENEVTINTNSALAWKMRGNFIYCLKATLHTLVVIKERKKLFLSFTWCFWWGRTCSTGWCYRPQVLNYVASVLRFSFISETPNPFLRLEHRIFQICWS